MVKRRTVMRSPIAAIVALLTLAAPAVAAEGAGLEVDRARLCIKADAAGRHSVKVTGSFDTERFPFGYRFAPAMDDVRVLVGGREIVPTSRDEATTWRSKWGHRFKMRRRSDPSVKLLLDFGTGRLVLKARRCDLTGVDPSASGGVSIGLTIGDGVFEASSVCRKKRHRYRYRAGASEDPPPGGGPEDPPSLVPAQFRVLVDAARYADETEPIWEGLEVLRSEQAWISVYLEFLEPWLEYEPISEDEMVVTMNVPGDVYTVFEVYREGNGLLVRFKTGLLPPPPEGRKDMVALRVVAVPKVAGAVRFEQLP
jgi:hypothetical protein